VLETRQAAAAAALASVGRRATATEKQLNEVARRTASARGTLRKAHRLLALRLRTLYEAGDPDPLALMLGAGSLQEALDGLDGLRFAAQHDRDIIADTTVARRRLARLAGALRARRPTLARLRDQAAVQVAALGRAAAARRAYLSRLASERGPNQSGIAAVQAEASAAREGTQRVWTPAAAVPARAQAPRALTVRAVGYSLEGSTVTGVPVGWGIVAVDPTVIPLGTRLTIPGYGEGVAADTGPGVAGATIDLWFPSRAQALAWGSRTITVTVHS